MNNESLVDTAIGVGELGTKKPALLQTRVHEEQSISRPVAKRQMNGRTRLRKGKVTTSPRKNKEEARARKHIQVKGNQNQDQAGSPNEDGQRTLGDFGVKSQ